MYLISPAFNNYSQPFTTKFSIFFYILTSAIAFLCIRSVTFDISDNIYLLFLDCYNLCNICTTPQYHAGSICTWYEGKKWTQTLARRIHNQILLFMINFLWTFCCSKHTFDTDIGGELYKKATFRHKYFSIRNYVERAERQVIGGEPNKINDCVLLAFYKFLP